jgi:hypothetical protein
VVLLEDGRIVADGTHAELLETTPQYAEVLAQVDPEAGVVLGTAHGDHPEDGRGDH